MVVRTITDDFSRLSVVFEEINSQLRDNAQVLNSLG